MAQSREAQPAKQADGHGAAHNENTATLRACLPLLIELNDLKRVHTAGRAHSRTARMFRRAWQALIAGEAAHDVAERETAYAVVAARLGDINRAVMRDAGLAENTIRVIHERAFDQVACGLDDAARRRFRLRFTEILPQEEFRREAIERGNGNEQGKSVAELSISRSPTPAFVELLIEQPRAGATRPGRNRVMLEPAETHADHCGTVAVYAALLAGFYPGADPTTAFLAGLAHHLQNAYLPDAGYAADEIIGEHLPALFDCFRRRALDELSLPLRSTIEEALMHTRDASTPIARAFQAADVLDRVLEMRWHAQSADFTLRTALDEMDIVHPGITQEFHLSVMRDAGLM